MTKPYIDYTFTGVKPFSEALDEAMVSYRVFAPEKSAFLFTDASEYLDKKKDTLELGSMTRGGNELFYLQVAMEITKSFSAHSIFIFDHEPAKEDLVETLKDLLPLTEARLNAVQDEITPTLMEEAQRNKHNN